MSNEMRDWQADEIQELKGLIKELEAIIAIRNVRIAPEPLDMERWVQLSHCAVLEAEKTSTPDAPRNPDDTLYYWAFQTLAIQESAITDQQARIAELEGALTAAYQEGWEAGKDTCVVDGDFSHDFKDSSTKALLGGEG